MRRDPRWLLVVVLGSFVSLAIGARAAHAQAAGDAAAPAPAPPADSEKDRKAKELYEQGNTHYDLAEYDQAIDLFKQAYALSRRPTLLYNIAQAYRLKGDCEQALQVYKNYLRVDTNTQIRAKVESRIEEMAACAKDPSRKPPAPEKEAIQKDAGKPAVPPTTTTPPLTPEPAPAPAPASESRGGTKKMIGLITGGVGVALVGTGVYFSVQAGSKADDVSSACTVAAPCDWGSDLASLESDGEAAERNALILYAVGGAAIAGGVVLYLLGASEASAADAPRVSFVPLRGGGGLATAGFSF
jgi:tetratricopeptide (TPR) repeat protein